jgi:RNA polymerase sigma-70 factor, ECF subfamily
VTENAAPVDFRTLFQQQFSYVWSVLRRLGVRESDAEDLAHEVFLIVFKKLSEYEPSRPLRPWLFAFAFRVASDHRRRAHHRREVRDADANPIDPAPRPDAQAAASEDRSLLAEALAELDLERRAVLVMHEWDGESIPDVARALEIPLNTAYSRLRLAREDLAAAVSRIAQRRRRP